MYKVLIADDYESNREIVRLCLGEAFSGLEIHEASNGQDAYNLVSHSDYHLIVLDLMMPKMTGFEFLSQFSKMNKSAYILVVSAKQEIEYAIKALDAGAHDYIRLPFDSNEMTARLKAIFRIIQAENQLIQSISLVEHESMHLLPIVSIAHDMSNILSQLSNLDLLKLGLENLRSNPSPRASEEIERLEKILERTSNSVSWAIDICNGLMSVDPALKSRELSGIYELTNPILEIFGYRVSLRNIKLKVIETGEFKKFHCDPTEFQRILLNLVSNSMKALEGTKDQGQIIIKFEFVENELLFSVEDNGCGISKEDMTRVFIERFSSSEREVSTGIGLSYVKKVCDKNRWNIELRSEADIGTKVTIQIPLN